MIQSLARSSARAASAGRGHRRDRDSVRQPQQVRARQGDRHLKLDRVLYSAVHYPGDYGFIPRTLHEDGDPLDVLVLVKEQTFPGCMIDVRPLGVLQDARPRRAGRQDSRACRCTIRTTQEFFDIADIPAARVEGGRVLLLDVQGSGREARADPGVGEERRGDAGDRWSRSSGTTRRTCGSGRKSAGAASRSPLDRSSIEDGASSRPVGPDRLFTSAMRARCRSGGSPAHALGAVPVVDVDLVGAAADVRHDRVHLVDHAHARRNDDA